MLVDYIGRIITDCPAPMHVDYLSYDDDDANKASSIVPTLLYNWRKSEGKGAFCTAEYLFDENPEIWENLNLQKIHNKCLVHYNDSEESGLRWFALRDAVQFMHYWIFCELNNDANISYELAISEGEYHYIYVDDTPGIGRYAR